MALGDGITWDESTPTDATTANTIDDYDRDLRKGVRNRMALEHEWPSSQSATSEAGRHKYISLQSQASVPVISGTQLGSIYMSSGNTLMFSVGTTAGSQIMPFAAPAGSIIQVVSTTNTSVVTDTAGIPHATAPQITDGTQGLSLSITPSSTANYLLINANVVLGAGAAAYEDIVALFQGTTAAALAVSVHGINNAANERTLHLMWHGLAATTAAIPFQVRFGCAPAYTCVLNGTVGTFGNVPGTTMIIQEIKG